MVATITDRQAGSLLVELMISIGVLVVGLLGFLGSYASNSRALNTMGELDEVAVALEDVTEMLKAQAFESLYASYDGVTVEVPELQGPDGQPARVEISCFIDETSLPPEFGPVLDIDGNPDADVKDASNTYQILPIRLRLNYATFQGPQTRVFYLVVDPD